jgi:hypothetical protein
VPDHRRPPPAIRRSIPRQEKEQDRTDERRDTLRESISKPHTHRMVGPDHEEQRTRNNPEQHRDPEGECRPYLRTESRCAMTDIGPHMTRRECCRTGLRLLALAGLLGGGVSLVNGRGKASAAQGAPCGDAAGCPGCPWRRSCSVAPAPTALDPDSASANREGRR